MKAIRVHEFGGPERLVLTELPTPRPASGQALVQVHAAGVNFIDVYQRSGQYELPLPLQPGLEGARVVEQLGPFPRECAAAAHTELQSRRTSGKLLLVVR